MAALEHIGTDFVQDFLKREGHTTEMLSDILKSRFPGKRGFSVRSIERFCQDNRIVRKGYVSDQQLDEIVCNAVSQVTL